ncbi:MAG TPA: 30S ribosome-binding factor RbfA [Candidatus Faeciplasma avium]|mgnify:FL=1|uniref:Ribosome-binding factor A n=1 Tax=Candidatus Faeciplasma avium TaxID=2840798 RepID=A0A9D1NQF9_9FIRM|nr:30S ribosome-binding factor RbfA [Candidatus Faeciplasma avium]
MADYKSGRLASDITRIISGMLPRLKDPRIKDRLLTVVRVELTRDRSVARIYLSSLNGIGEAREAVKGLESAQGLIKREISGVLGIKKAPELRFIADDSSEYSARISRMLKELNLPGEDTVDPEPDSDTEEQDA